MGCHRRTGWPQQLVSPKVPFVEQDQQFLVECAGGGVGEHEAFQFGFAIEPVVGAPAEQFLEIIEIVGAYRLANFDCSRRVTGFPE
jgi:hypothetical protein